MISKAEGIVFRSIKYGEADLIVSFFTFEDGIIDFFVKSPRKIKSRYGSAFEPCTYSKIEYWKKEGHQLPRLIRSDIVYPFQKLRENFDHFLKSSELFEMTLNLVPPRLPQKELFYMLIDTMKSLENSTIMLKKALFYKAKLLTASGYVPRLSGCAICGKEGRAFFFHEGAVVCPICKEKIAKEALTPKLYLSYGAIKLFEKARVWDWKKLDRLVPSMGLLNEIDNMIDLHIKFQTEKNNKTKAFIKRMGYLIHETTG
ncbi:MAG: DNA repair protein RecO [Candidatus Magnetoovum sp. WYHC-5]|nr:DNA repair protein RecO [Candidatus Magnetoovum sp. WYHC-5]